MKLKGGVTIEKNGIRIRVHDVANGIVYFRKWPKGIEEQGFLENLYRMPVDEFENKLERED